MLKASYTSSLRPSTILAYGLITYMEIYNENVYDFLDRCTTIYVSSYYYINVSSGSPRDKCVCACACVFVVFGVCVRVCVCVYAY